MRTMRWLTRMMILVAVCAALVLPHSVAAAEGGIVPGSVVAKALGTFRILLSENLRELDSSAAEVFVGYRH